MLERIAGDLELAEIGTVGEQFWYFFSVLQVQIAWARLLAIFLRLSCKVQKTRVE